MGGAILHIGLGLISGIIVYSLYSTNLLYSIGIFVGNLLPDVLKFGLTALKQGTLNIFNIERDAFFKVLSVLTGSYFNWLVIGFLLLVGLLISYHYHYLKKKEVENYVVAYVLLLIGVYTHIVVDLFVNEKGFWF